MITGWIMYSIVLFGCLAGAARLGEGAARDGGRPTRWIWALAGVVGLVVSGMAFNTPLSVIHLLVPGPAQAPWLSRPASSYIAIYESLTRWDPVVLVVLFTASGIAAAVFAMSIARLMARRRRWRQETVEGHSILVSDSDGPAVIGFVRSAIVLPQWAIAESAAVRRMILTHELEHQRAGDSWLVLLALVLVVAQPWNPFAWWMAHRVRLAMEVDCDARVLSRGSDVRSYGTLLLDVGTRAHCAVPGAGPAFSTPPSALEQRLRIMTARRRPGAAASAGLLLALALSAAAVTLVPEPSGLHCVFSDLGFPAASR
jgi:bla regulator protein blaR1